MAIDDEYRMLLAREGVAKCREYLSRVKEIVRYGRASEPGASLFERELEAMKAKGKADREDSGDGPPDLLLLTVGTSPEPLLLAVAYHAPQRVVPFIELHFPDDERREFARLWDRVHERLGQPDFAALTRRTVRAQPGSLFREVEAEVRAARAEGLGRIVLDFTGAKKTIVAGAFLAAGFLGIEATHIDFARYDSTLNRPVPGSSFPAAVAHPVEIFRLRERERLAETFDARRFEEAGRWPMTWPRRTSGEEHFHRIVRRIPLPPL